MSPRPVREAVMTLSPTHVGLFTGLLLGLAFAIDGFSAFLFTAFLAAAGVLVAKVVQGDIDVNDYIGSNRRR